MDIFKVFKVLTKEKKRYCVWLVFCMLIAAVLEAVGVGAILPLISLLGQPDFLQQHPQLAFYAKKMGIETHVQFMMSLAAGMVVFYIVKNVYIAWMNRQQIRFSLDNQVECASNLMWVYLRKSYLYHVEQNSANIIRNVNAGPSSVFSRILTNLFSLLTELITAVMIWGMLVLTDLFTAIVVAVLLGGMMYAIIKSFRRQITKQGAIQAKYSAEYLKWLNQGLGAIKETKVMQKEEYFQREFAASYKKYGDANQDYMFLGQLPRLIIETLVTAGLLLLIICKLFMGENPSDIVPLLGVLALAAFRLMPCANRVVGTFNIVKFELPFFNMIYGDLLEARGLADKGMEMMKPAVKMAFSDTLKADHLSFAYPQSTDPVLEDVNFEVPKGCFCGIIGSSGAGKTTFVDIMLGLLQPTGGRITVDGQNIAENMRGWQKNLAYVPQSIYLIDGTIKENIALGTAKNKIDDAKMKRVLDMAELADFVADLPDGVNTMVGEQGVKLSGGQRQRIGIARALYCEPEVLILDEATSALDNETEKNITDTILRLKGKITIVAIAHRVSTLEECDFKVKFEDGRAEVVDG